MSGRSRPSPDPEVPAIGFTPHDRFSTRRRPVVPPFIVTNTW